MAQGMSNREIADAMKLSSKTVEAYLTRVYAKTGLPSRLALAVAVESGVLEASAPRRERSGPALDGRRPFHVNTNTKPEEATWPTSRTS